MTDDMRLRRMQPLDAYYLPHDQESLAPSPSEVIKGSLEISTKLRDVARALESARDAREEALALIDKFDRKGTKP